MKVNQKDSEKLIWDQMRSPSGTPLSVTTPQNRALPKLMVWLILFVSATYVVYTLKLVSSSHSCDNDDIFSHSHNHLSFGSSNKTISSSGPLIHNQAVMKIDDSFNRTQLKHIAFGIAASAKLWEKRKNYIKLWWKPKEMRGVVWLDSPVKTSTDESLPPVRISGDTSKFAYKNRQGHRSAIRISRIVSETLRLGMENVR